ncbi:hypothetical protein D3C85_1713110 [compost metagenome]
MRQPQAILALQCGGGGTRAFLERVEFLGGGIAVMGVLVGTLGLRVVQQGAGLVDNAVQVVLGAAGRW